MPTTFYSAIASILQRTLSVVKTSAIDDHGLQMPRAGEPFVARYRKLGVQLTGS